MYGLEVRSCTFTLTEDLKNKYGTLLNGEISSYEVFKNGKSIGQFLHVIYSTRKQGYIYLSDLVNNLPCEERLYLRTFLED